WSPGRAAGRRGRVRDGLAVGSRAFVLDDRAVARGRGLRRRTAPAARARGMSMMGHRLSRRTLLAGALATPAIARAQDGGGNLRELARRAAIYFFPVCEMYRTRWRACADEANPYRQKLNRFLHAPVLADHRARAVTTPNNDTLYSSAWLDLS